MLRSTDAKTSKATCRGNGGEFFDFRDWWYGLFIYDYATCATFVWRVLHTLKISKGVWNLFKIILLSGERPLPSLHVNNSQDAYNYTIAICGKMGLILQNKYCRTFIKLSSWARTNNIWARVKLHDLSIKCTNHLDELCMLIFCNHNSAVAPGIKTKNSPLLYPWTEHHKKNNTKRPIIKAHAPCRPNWYCHARNQTAAQQKLPAVILMCSLPWGVCRWRSLRDRQIRLIALITVLWDWDSVCSLTKILAELISVLY